MDEEHFLDFVSTRSPVFKTRPLPKSKKEAIDLMVQQPNLIRRPILVRGSKVVFGFDKKEYRLDTAHENSPHRNVRLELPHRRGDLERDLLSAGGPAAARERPVRRAAVLRGTLRHGRSELDVLSHPHPGDCSQLGEADAGAASSSR